MMRGPVCGPVCPENPRYLASGYAVPNPDKGLGGELLQKPFTVEAFLVLVRRLLAGER
jgi:hypothetical protein